MSFFKDTIDQDKISALPSSIQAIIRAIYKAPDLSPGKVKNIVKQAQVQEHELLPWADFDHPQQDCYGRKMVYDGGFFDIMVMSWVPGDFSALHDHGYAQWGAVQTFGAAEHAVFWIQDSEIRTLSRQIMKAGQVIGVGHQLVHQMGNSGTHNYLSLHIYGNYTREENVTADARIFDLDDQDIHRADGGAFFALPLKQIKSRETCPTPDFLTRLRHQVELIRRVQRAENLGKNESGKSLKVLTKDLFDVRHWSSFVNDLAEHLDDTGQNNHSVFWKLLNWELKEAAALQSSVSAFENTEDYFHTYAELYDEVLGKPCLDEFMAAYLRFFIKQYNIDFTRQKLISIGCGTGLMEQFMINELGMPQEHLYGIDISEAMIKVAQTRIHAEVGDALELDPAIKMWDLTFCGLNVFQYVDHTFLQQVIEQAARITSPGGHFFGDFITPDHIRGYPHVLYSECGDIVSLRSPELIEKDHYMYQRSSIVNVSKKSGRLRITNEGQHTLFLPPLSKVREYFKQAFDGGVDLYDAVSLAPIPADADTCTSTRYLVVAKKAK
ncbi:methyltransferase domain-containing protein [uncultured Microscilla sp.]|uniref:methyltransferase domain-containing protein n=1 Tax=uncultured Microscilla sp. TaxID=432653 RepID=UPI00261FB3D0|nr:methyltransferase domain-containing protein [uncultured Microscilla sp.]